MSMLSVLLGVRIKGRLRPRRHRAGPTPKLSDAQVLEARRRHEVDGASATDLLRYFGFAVTKNTRHWMAGILCYQFRSSPTKPLDPNLQERR